MEQFSPLAAEIHRLRYAWDANETWAGTAKRVASLVNDTYQAEVIASLITQRKFIPGGRYLYAAGRDRNWFTNCFSFRAEDSREGWGELGDKAYRTLMTGGGIGVDYSGVRPNGATISRTGGKASGPVSLMRSIDGIGREVMMGGNRRAAIMGILDCNHADIQEFLHAKDYPESWRKLKLEDPNLPLPLEFTNISVSYSTEADLNCPVFLQNVRQACKTAEPGMLFNFKNPRESLRNPCGELVSEDDSDRCNLGTIWLNRISSMAELERTVDYAVYYLLIGGMLAEYPTERIDQVGKQNNRIGLGLGGIWEWLISRGYDYEVVPELASWLKVYAETATESAARWAARLGVSVPKATRAIAPNGTIGLLAETTSGIEPLFCAAYRRRYRTPDGDKVQFVVDPMVQRLLAQGVSIDLIEANDAYSIGFEQRVKFQADVQDYVDMAISSTCNIHPWGSALNHPLDVERKADIIRKYAPRLRGFTCYPDGARGHQPITKATYEEAEKHAGRVFDAAEARCMGGVCGA